MRTYDTLLYMLSAIHIDTATTPSVVQTAYSMGYLNLWSSYANWVINDIKYMHSQSL